MTTELGNLDLTRRFYRALAVPDPAALGDLLDANFRAELTAGLPGGWGGAYASADELFDRCWRPIFGVLETRPVPAEYLPSGPDRMVVLGRYQGHHRQTRRVLDAAFVHVLRFENGRISSLLQVTDSARWHDALAAVGSGDALRTPLCARLGIDVPIVQAPIGSAATPELVAAVAEGGALGMLAVTWVSVEEAVRRIRAVRALTRRPFGVNLVLAFPVDDLLEACLEERVPVISTFWGDPATVSDRIRGGGALHLHTVSGVDEARRAAASGVDAVVAQGYEAGGHVAGTIGALPLIPAVVDSVAPLPVVAAGGIGDGRGVAAALALGAQAAWLGTRFLAAAESGAHERYCARVVAAGANEAVYTRCFDGGWPDAPHRVLRNDTLSAWEAAGSPRTGERPGENGRVAATPHGRPILRYDESIPLRGVTGEVEEMALYAGQSVELVRAVAGAGEIIEALVSEARAALARQSIDRDAACSRQ